MRSLRHLAFVFPLLLLACAPATPVPATSVPSLPTTVRATALPASSVPATSVQATAISPAPTATATTALSPTVVVVPTATALPKASKPLKLVASTPVIADALRNLMIGIEGVSVEVLVPLGADPHEYEPTPADARKLNGASAVFVTGAQFEDEWLSKLLRTAGGGQKVVEVSRGMTLTRIDPVFDAEFERDPHVWMDPDMWQKAVQTMGLAIAELDAAIAPAVGTNVQAYRAKITQADAAATALLFSLPAERRVLVTTHDAMGYWAAHHGFKVVGTIFEGPSTTAGALNPRNIKALSDKIKQQKVKAIFAEAGVNPKLTEAVAREAGITIIETLYVDTLSAADGPASTYVDLIMHNARTIAAALK